MIRPLTRLFVDHPREVGESYLHHAVAASRFGLRLAGLSGAAFLHALVPALHRTTVSTEIKHMADDLGYRAEVARETRMAEAGAFDPVSDVTPMPQALAGVRVLDLSRVLAGPWATQLLADLGAEVIKIERPGVGDDTRAWGPPFTTKTDGSRGDSAYFMCANRGKKSVALDMASAEGTDTIRRLAATCDVVVENFKVGGLAKYGLDYASLSKDRPKDRPALVYCSITGFGQTGPRAQQAGYDYMIQAMGGLMSVTGQPDGSPGAEPMKVGVAVVDLATGLYASNAILAALLHARATGQGQHIDIALFDVQAAMLANQATNYFVSGTAPTRMGNAHPNLVPYQPFPCVDGRVVIAVGNDGQFRTLCAVLGAEALAADTRYATNAGRIEHRAELVAAISAMTGGMTMAGLMEALEAAGVPCGPINTIEQVFDEPQAVHRGLQVEQTRDDLATPVRTVASPIQMSGTPIRYNTPPPALGQDTRNVLRSIENS